MKNKILINLNNKLYNLEPGTTEWHFVEQMAINCGYKSLVDYADEVRWKNTIKSSIADLGEQLKQKRGNYMTTKNWNVNLETDSYVIRDENDLAIATVNNNQTNDKDFANLLCAAPELLEAVRRAFVLENANHGMTAHARAYINAIAKAEGTI